MKIKRLFDLLNRYETLYLNKANAFSGTNYGSWASLSASDYIEYTDFLSYSLIDMGIKKGEKILSISFNRPLWNILDMALLSIGAIHVSIHYFLSDNSLKNILLHSEAKYIFVSDIDIYYRIKELISDMPKKPEIYSFKAIEGQHNIYELIKKGRENPKDEELKKIRESISENDIATIIYTPGNSSIQKAVMLTHKNIISNVYAYLEIFTFSSDKKAMCIIPICSIYERVLNYFYQYQGIAIYYVDYIGNLAEYAPIIKPNMIAVVPRILEKMYNRAETINSKQIFFKRILFYAAISVANRYNENGNTLIYRMILSIAKATVFKKWKKRLGNNIDYLFCGGDKLPIRLLKIYWAMGIKVIQGYGTTETSSVISSNNLKKEGIKFGSVGYPLNNYSLSIADDGEILCKGPSISPGYFKDDKLTENMYNSDGWFKTGDIGYLDKKNRLYIIGRKNELFKTQCGNWVSPHKIESLLKESPFINRILVIGKDRQFIAALISPDFRYLKTWCEKHNFPFINYSEAIENPKIIHLFQHEINHFNKILAPYEQIKKFILINKEWSVENDELSPLLRLRRNTLPAKYQSLIEKMYQHE